ncbi:MAG: N-methyl-L-tryptophan oxidase [Myxococcales bacterium]|nr:N-methyl-L-tryptophan oxidase [Myxococcales bacterium]
MLNSTGVDHYDAIVVGVGGMGSLTCHALSRRGARVLGLEQFTLGHDRGSSYGETRLYRRAYFEAPEYVPLMDRALTLWRELEAATGEELVVETGLVLAGGRASEIIRGAELAARVNERAFERLTPAEARLRFPDFAFSDDQSLLFEAEAGFIRVERAVRASAAAASRAGAALVYDTRVTGFESDAHGVRVSTTRGEYHAGSLIFTAGPWSGPLLGSLGLVLRVQRQVLLWLRVDASAHRLDAGAPAFGFDTRGGFFYGFPCLEPGVLKLARHRLGDAIPSPKELDRGLGPGDVEPVAEFVRAHLPRARAEVLRHHVCMYTLTPDEHFIVDRHPEHNHVWVAAGFSGHGFKFASVIGEALAELATAGSTHEPIGFLSAARFGHFGAV